MISEQAPDIFFIHSNTAIWCWNMKIIMLEELIRLIVFNANAFVLWSLF